MKIEYERNINSSLKDVWIFLFLSNRFFSLLHDKPSLKTISILYLLYYDYSIPEKKIKHLISSTSKQNLPCVDKRTTNIQDSNRKPWRDSVINPVRASRPSIHVRCEKAWQFVLMTRETRFVSPECVQIVHPRTVTSILFVVHELA